jgi:hypothetical protein
MSRQAAATLTFNGLVVLLLGLIAGAPYGAALVGEWGEEAARAWKLAHTEGVLNGIMVLALAGCAPWMALGRAAQRVVGWGAVLAAYGNVVGATLGALTGQRGLAPQGPAANWLVFIAFMFGMWGVLVAVPTAAVGAWRELRARGGT